MRDVGRTREEFVKTAEKTAQFVNIFDLSFPFRIDMVERRLSLHYVSAVLLIAHDRDFTRNTRVNLRSVAQFLYIGVFITVSLRFG